MNVRDAGEPGECRCVEGASRAEKRGQWSAARCGGRAKTKEASVDAGRWPTSMASRLRFMGSCFRVNGASLQLCPRILPDKMRLSQR